MRNDDTIHLSKNCMKIHCTFVLYFCERLFEHFAFANRLKMFEYILHTLISFLQKISSDYNHNKIN